LPIYGSGKNVREWIHVIDHCKAIQLVLESGHRGEIYNVGTGFHLTNLELASKILAKMGSNVSQIEFVEDRKGHDFRYSVNFEKLRNLGFNAEVNFEEGLDQTISWYKENQDWWA
jgi:dTDP-glucose 4,6-dehydratase